MWAHTGEYCLLNVVIIIIIIIIIIIYTGIEIKHLKCQTTLTYKQEGEQIIMLLFVSAAGFSFTGFPGGSDSKESASQCRRPGFSPCWGRSPGKGDGYPLQYSCLENSTDRGVWWATVHGVANSQTRQSDQQFSFTREEG